MNTIVIYNGIVHSEMTVHYSQPGTLTQTADLRDLWFSADTMSPAYRMRGSFDGAHVASCVSADSLRGDR